MHVDAALVLDSHFRTSFPSGVSVSGDGQILVLSHTYLHILTPALGLALRPDKHCLSGFPGNKTADQWERDKLQHLLQEGECQGLEFFKTSIEIQKAEIFWDEWTNDLRQTTPGGLDNGWRMASWSPSGLSELGGCILATLTVNREVHVYLPQNDPIKSAWTQAIDVTGIMLDDLAEANRDLVKVKHADMSQQTRSRKEALVLQAQATGISWSPAPPSFTSKDDSLLAISHRSGLTSFWRYDGKESMKRVAEISLPQRGGLLLAWTSWLLQSHPDSRGTIWYDAWLAIGCSTGPIQILRITISADSSVSVVLQHSCLESQKTVTLLKWLRTGQLVVGRLGEVSVWSPAATHTFPVAIGNYRGWSSIANPVEVLHLTQEDKLVITLMDGSLRVVEGLSTGSPTLSTLAKASSGTALRMTEGARRAFLAVERASTKNRATITPATAMLLAGCPLLDDSGTIVLSYEKHWLDVKTFQASKYHRQGVLFGKLLRSAEEPSAEHEAQQITQEIRNLIDVHEMCGVTASSKPMFPLFLSIKRAEGNEELPVAILEAVRAILPLVLPPPELFAKDDYIGYLLKDRSLHILRLLSLIVTFCLNTLELGDLMAEYTAFQHEVVRQIYSQVFEVLLRVLQTESLTENPLYTRYQQIVSQLSGPPPGSMQVDESDTPKAIEVFDNEIDQLDRCAACSEVIGFDKLGRATCRNGHEWLRCSVTVAVLSTSAARTCLVCSRKTRVPIHSDFQVDEAETASQLLLGVAKCCLFCGGRWTRGY